MNHKKSFKRQHHKYDIQLSNKVMKTKSTSKEPVIASKILR